MMSSMKSTPDSMTMMRSMKSIVDSMRKKISRRYLLQVSPIRSHMKEEMMVIFIALCVEKTLGFTLQGLKWSK